MSELVISLLQRGVADLLHSPFSSEDTEAAAASLPPPMLPANHQALSDRCFMGQAFRDNAVIADPQPDNWTWVNEAKASLRPKWGYVSYTPGSVLRLRVNTTASAGALDQRVLVQLAHLRSYEHMGQGSVTCAVRCDAAPCTCPHMVTWSRVPTHAHMHACTYLRMQPHMRDDGGSLRLHGVATRQPTCSSLLHAERVFCVRYVQV